MNKFDLSTYFVGAGGKILSRVEVEDNLSNQHEFNGVSSLKHLLKINEQYFLLSSSI